MQKLTQESMDVRESVMPIMDDKTISWIKRVPWNL